MPHSELHKKKLKTNLAIIGGIFVFCLIVMLVTMIKMAKADETGNVMQCGEAVTGSVETDPDFRYCDIYQRQLDYKESADQLREDINTRTENFAKPRKIARKQYEADLEQIHNSAK